LLGFVVGEIVNICSNIAHTPCGRHSKRHDRQTGHQNDKHWGFSTFFLYVFAYETRYTFIWATL